jgi:K+-transporting ATPase ATPase A chain
MNFLSHWMLLHILVVLMAYPLAKYVHFVQGRQLTIRWEHYFLKYLGLPLEPMDWKNYLRALFKFQILGWFVVFGLALRDDFSLASAFQLASSFVTNTNWQSISGTHHWQMDLWLFGILTQNFLSAGTGLCVLLVFARCFKARQSNLGNFWIDIWRMNIYLLLPLSLIAAIPLMWQGVPQNFSKNLIIQQYDSPHLPQLIPNGPIAAQESIKLLGTNGGSYTQANSAHPLENPSLLTHYEEMILMLLLPSMGAFLFARIYGRLRYGWYIWFSMFLLSSLLIFGAYYYESPMLLGKELRLGEIATVLWHGITTATATGATSGVIDQFQALTIGFNLFLMNLGELAFGGVGIGVVNLLFLFILSAFILGLLTGSSPVFLRNKLPLIVIKLTMIYIIFIPSLVLIGLVVYFAWNQFLLNYPPPYQVAGIWYAFSSWLNNNGSGFVGLSLSSTLMLYISGVLMILGRYIPISIALGVCGLLAKEQVLESTKSLIDVDSLIFVLTSIVVILIVTLLAFLPLWSLGPLALQGFVS